MEVILIPWLLLLIKSAVAFVSPENTLVWGTGLNADVVLPARYFYIQAVDHHGTNITESIGDTAFQVTVQAPDQKYPTRVWVQVFDRKDGSYIVRYKLFETYTDLTITVTYNNAPVSKSPFVLHGYVYSEKCSCPVSSLDQWLSTYQCPASYRQIKQDLSLFPAINMTWVTEQVQQRFNQRGSQSLCHYVVKNNQIYRKTYGQHVGFKMFMDAILLSLTRKVQLPDLEFFVNLGDWPLEKRHAGDSPAPILSWCGSDETRDIILPTYDITEATLETMGRVSLDIISVQGNTGPLWANKTPVAFFRGRDSRQERLNLVKLSRKHPDVLDAKITNMFFFKHEPELGELVKQISFFDFFKYKYQVNVDGTVAAYRLPYLLVGDSLVFKQESSYYEFFYKDLKPFRHYIPFKRDLSDLLEQIKWAKEHDAEAQQIARNAQLFARERLQGTEIFCYHVVLFKEYSKRLTVAPDVRPDMELVQEDKYDPRDRPCECHRNTKRNDEL